MSAEEIRKFRERVVEDIAQILPADDDVTAWALLEIAAQLAEANELKRQELELLRSDQSTNPDCLAKTCTYYAHYLAYGPADLAHEGFHAAEKMADNHFKSCTYRGENYCPSCKRHEERIRA